mgnify:CR=1 FL=1
MANPRYEQVANVLVLTVGAAQAGAAFALLVVLAAFTDSARVVVACVIYGASVFLSLLFAALYHGIGHAPTKAVFRLLDHLSIFVLIAGTYTPIALVALPVPSGEHMFWTIWALAGLGVGLRIWLGRLHGILIPVFLAMGWLCVFWGDALLDALGLAGAWLLVAGGCAYTGGLTFYFWRRLPYNQAIWHACVIGGAACHFLLISLYVVPRGAATVVG